jgi:hypothetical protein
VSKDATTSCPFVLRRIHREERGGREGGREGGKLRSLLDGRLMHTLKL